MNNPKDQILMVSDIQRTVGFYQDLLGEFGVDYDQDSQILSIAKQSVHLYCFPDIYQKTRLPAPGNAQVNLLIPRPLFTFVLNCSSSPLNIIFESTGMQRLSTGHLISVYLRDPDGNLVQISNLIPDLSVPRHR